MASPQRDKLTINPEIEPTSTAPEKNHKHAGTVNITAKNHPVNTKPNDHDVPSPCVRNCCLDDDNICLGCQRSITEITGWSKASNSEKQAILLRCQERATRRLKQKP